MKTKILIIEHDLAAITAIQHVLKIGHVNCITEIVQSAKEFEKALHQFKPDLILSNYTLPCFDGLTAFKIKQKLAPQTPLIFVSKTIGEENAIELIKNGVTDFVLKERLFTLTNKVNRALKEAEISKLIAKFKQSEEIHLKELGQNEAKFRGLFETNIDGVLLTRSDGEILAADPAACDIFQMTEKEIIDVGIFDLIDAPDSVLKILLDDVQLTGRTKGKLTFVRKDSSRFLGKFTLALFKDAYGEERTSMIIRDISERKNAEQALKASESFSKGILDSLTSHIAVINSLGTILKVNKSWNTFAQNNNGTSTEKYGEGANYFDACSSRNNATDDLASKALKGIKDVLNGIINEFYLEYPCHSPVTERWFNMRVNKFESSETMVLIEHHDISERKMAEQKLSITTKALQKSLNDNNKILDFSLDLICSYNEEGRFVHMNAASERILGYKPQELIGKKYMDFIFHDDAENTRMAAIDIRSGVQLTMFENRFIHKNGSIVPLLWSAVWDDEYKMSYCMAKDVTDKKNLEKAFEIERQRFHDLYLQAPSCMGILKGSNHVYELANNLYLQLIDKKDIIGKTVKEVLPELEAQGIFKFLDTVYKTGETFSANEMLVKFDHNGNGKLVDTYLNFIYQAHRDADGNIDGILFFANDVTEQVLSRKKIEDSLLRYTSLIEQASDAICFMDASMKIIEVNHYACEKLGYSKAEILQLSAADFFLKEDLKANPIKIDPLKGGNTVRGERKILTKDGTLIDVELSAKILKDGNMLLFVRDVSEHKKAQQTVMESEKKYRQIVETAQEGIWLIDENHKTTFVNNKMCEILEYTQKEMMGKEIYFFMDDEGPQIVAKLMKKKKEGHSNQRHFKYISKSGKEIWANVAANPFISESGIYEGSMAMVTDITEIKKAQQTLKENEKKYRYLFDNNPMPMWVIDLITFKFLDVNKMAILQYGYSREEFLSMTALDIRPDQDKDHFIKSNNSSEINATNFNRGIWNHLKKDRTIIPVEIIAHEIIYEGVPARFILSNDITDRRKAELNLERRNKELIKTNSELDRFVYSVSHDLRSPLTSILGLLSFIETESLETDTLEHAKMIRNSINRLDEFIKNILSYSRNNRTGLEIEKISVQEKVLAIVHTLQSLKEAKEIHFEIDIKEQQPFYTDRLRFNTILENLISNAIKHHKKDLSGRYIKITGRSDYEKLQLTIADNGIGIALKYHQKIFDMFFRLSGKTDGSGIGLYIVKDAVEILQGSIEIQSEKGTGTTFIVTLKNLKP
ncbi:PAS domain S-box protein [Flavobacterium sp. ZS1P14]|uniref:PAS domain S-box protein n=1 Tax=Flavobacterium sp. ZS1P14 TaxID=3401729 RepID=UPI003AAA8B90